MYIIEGADPIYLRYIQTSTKKTAAGRPVAVSLFFNIHSQYTIMPLYNLFALELFEERAFGDAQIAGAAEGGEGTVLL